MWASDRSHPQHPESNGGRARLVSDQSRAHGTEVSRWL